jgi:hypothetical protein
MIIALAKGHSARSDLFWRLHQYAAFCYLLKFLCNWGVHFNLASSKIKAKDHRNSAQLFTTAEAKK